jgi:hypothetical protein
MSVFNTPEPPVKARQIDLLPPLPKPGDIRVNSITRLSISGFVLELPADEGVHGGINRLAFLDKENKPRGLITHIEPWLSMAAGDEWIIEAIYSPGNPITLVSDTVGPTQVDQRLTQVISQDRLPDGVCDLVVGVRRISSAGGDYERSPPLTVLIKTTLPGGPDPVPGEKEPYHQGLAPIEVERDILDSGVTKDYLDDNNGVPITIAPYENMRKNSRIFVLWGDIEIRLPLITANQVGKPIKFTIPKSLLTNLPPVNPLLLTYRLQDVVNNHSAANAPPIFFQFDPALVLLEPPIIDRADSEQQLDLDALKGEDVETLISSSKVVFGKGDVVDLSWRGVSAGGRQVPVNMQWKPEASSRSHSFMIDYYPVHLIARGFAKVDYLLTQNTTPPTLRYSRTTYAKMIGMPLKLAAPVVPEAKGGSVAVDTDPAHVIVKSQPGAIILDDVIYIYWYVITVVGIEDFYAASSPVSADMVDKDIEFTVPKDYIEEWEGAKVHVEYTVRRKDTAPVDSETLVLEIGDITAELPPPEVNDAKDGVLIPEDVPNGAVVTIKPYPGKRALHTIRLDFIGANQQDSWKSPTLEVEPEMVEGDITQTVPFEKLLANRNNTVELVYTVTNPFTKTQRVSERLRLNIGSPIPNPDITAVKDGNGNDIPRNSQTFATRATLTGTAGVSVPIELRNHGVIVATPTSTAGKTWSHTLTTLAPGSYSFTVQNPGTNRPSAIWAFTVQESQTPIIDSVKAGSSTIPNNGATYYQSNISIHGSASPGHRIDIYDGGTLLGSVTAIDTGDWTLPARNFSFGGHSITARTTDGSNKTSLAYTFTVQQGLSADITNFHYRGFNGWAGGSAIQPRDLTFHFNHGQYVLNNYTYTNWSSGVLLYKTFYNLQPNVNYTFTIRIARFYPQFVAPLIKLRTDQSAGQAWSIGTAAMSNLTITFKPTTPQLTLYIESLEASGSGNDWDMAWIQVAKA